MSTEADSAPVYDLTPQWTVPSFERTRGKYPLGAEAVALSQLATRLASGIPVQSRHPRYWSLYTYAIKQFWDGKRSPQNSAALGRFLKTREVVFACAALLCPRHPELSGIVGQDILGPWVRAHTSDSDELPLDLHYLKQAMGGYGQIYRGAMADLGLVLLAENNPEARLDAPYGDLGVAVADTFGRAIAGTTYARRYADQVTGSIPTNVVRELAEASCFCRLGEYPTERDLLTDVLLGRAQQPSVAHEQRAETVRLFLDLARTTDGEPVDDSRFRHLLYYSSSAEGAQWRVQPERSSIWQQWWLIQLREHVVAALNSLFVHFTRWGITQGGMLRPLGLEEYIGRVEAVGLPHIPGLPAVTSADVRLAELADTFDAVVAQEGWPVTRSAGASPLSELTLQAVSGRGLSPVTPVSSTLSLLMAQRRLAYRRSHHGLSIEEKAMLHDGDVERLGTQTVLDWLAGCVEQNQALSKTIVDLVRLMVIRQHLRVARSKLPEDTFRFYEEAGGYRFVDHGDAGLSPISIRFDALSTALFELGLIQRPLTKEGHAPTERGMEIRRG